MYNATISADVIASSSLTAKEIDELTQHIHWLFGLIKENHETREKEPVYCRLVSGDMIECLIKDPRDALRIALIIKTGIKSFNIHDSKSDKAGNKYRKLFQKYGIRIGIGIGEMNLDLVEKDILNGDAINRSGRLISEQKTSNKKRVVIKNTMFFDAPVKKHRELFSMVMLLLDELLNKATLKQSQIIFFKLLGYNENEISAKIGINQSVVNQQSLAVGWHAIKQAVRYFTVFNFQK